MFFHTIKNEDLLVLRGPIGLHARMDIKASATKGLDLSTAQMAIKMLILKISLHIFENLPGDV